MYNLCGQTKPSCTLSNWRLHLSPPDLNTLLRAHTHTHTNTLTVFVWCHLRVHHKTVFQWIEHIFHPRLPWTRIRNYNSINSLFHSMLFCTRPVLCFILSTLTNLYNAFISCHCLPHDLIWIQTVNSFVKMWFIC